MKRSSKNRLPVTNIGITTLITVFLILCLVTFACLSYMNVKADKQLSDELTAHSRQYYEAVRLANEQLADLACQLEDARKNNEPDSISQRYTFSVPVGTEHALMVEAVPLYEGNELYRLTRYEVVSIRSWEGDHTILPLQTKGN